MGHHREPHFLPLYALRAAPAAPGGADRCRDRAEQTVAG